jgi:hypothetical protein
MITREFTHTFNVDLVVTREGSELVVTAETIDSDGGEFHTPSEGPIEVAREDFADLADDPVVGHDIHDGPDGPVDKTTEAAVIMYVYGEDE